jgi:hypothetical protein
MTTYYEIKAVNIDGDTEVLFGSFVKADVRYELDAEKDSWKGEGYKLIKIVSRTTTDTPDPDVYADDTCEICGKIEELGHNDVTGLALCTKCDSDNQEEDSIELKYAHIQIGERVRAYDFEPCEGRSDRYVEGVVVKKVTMTCGAYALKLDVDTDTLSPHTRKGVHVPLETTMDDLWETDRVQVIKPIFTSPRAYRDYMNRDLVAA